MIWRAVLLAAALLALPAWAAAPRVAILYDGRTPVDALGSVLEDLLVRNGQPYDVFSASRRSWGAAGQADSAWFRERYAAVVIPLLDGNTSLASTWGTNFLNNAALAGIQRSPLSGRWTIPVYVLYPRAFSFANSGTDETANAWIPGGVRVPTQATLPAQASRGTWGRKMLCRFRGDYVDTLYDGGLGVFQCLRPSWPLPATTAALVWAPVDSMAIGCTAGDTIVAMWRFRPLAGSPGITYSALGRTRNDHINGILAVLQMVYSQTPCRPSQRIQVMVRPHGYGSGNVGSAAAVAHLAAMRDTFAANGVPLSLVLPQVGAADYAVTHDASTRAELRRATSLGALWQPGTNNGSMLLNGTDTTGARIAYNSIIRTATNPDSFGLPAARLDKSNFVPAAGSLAPVQLKTLADAGVQAVVSLFSAPQTPALVLASPVSGQRITARAPGDTRVLHVYGTIGWTDGATFASVRGANTMDDWVGSNVTQRIGWVIQSRDPVYLHTNTNVTGSDGYWRWFASVVGRHFRFYDRVIEPTNAPSPLTPRNTFTARF